MLLAEVGGRRTDVIQAVRTLMRRTVLRSQLLVDAAPVVVVEEACSKRQRTRRGAWQQSAQARHCTRAPPLARRRRSAQARRIVVGASHRGIDADQRYVRVPTAGQYQRSPRSISA